MKELDNIHGVRDIMKFVKYEYIHYNDRDYKHDMEELKAQILEEIPEQVLGYYKKIGARLEDIKPRNSTTLNGLQTDSVRLTIEQLKTLNTLDRGNTINLRQNIIFN